MSYETAPLNLIGVSKGGVMSQNGSYVHSSFWDDDWVDELSIKERYFYLYLITTSHRNLIGCYKLPKIAIERHTKLSMDEIKQLLDVFEHKYNKITYIDDFLILRNAIKYKYIENNSNLTRGMQRQLKKLPPNIKSLVLETLNNTEYLHLLNKPDIECHYIGDDPVYLPEETTDDQNNITCPYMHTPCPHTQVRVRTHIACAEKKEKEKKNQESKILKSKDLNSNKLTFEQKIENLKSDMRHLQNAERSVSHTDSSPPLMDDPPNSSERGVDGSICRGVKSAAEAINGLGLLKGLINPDGSRVIIGQKIPEAIEAAFVKLPPELENFEFDTLGIRFDKTHFKTKDGCANYVKEIANLVFYQLLQWKLPKKKVVSYFETYPLEYLRSKVCIIHQRIKEQKIEKVTGYVIAAIEEKKKQITIDEIVPEAEKINHFPTDGVSPCPK